MPTPASSPVTRHGLTLVLAGAAAVAIIGFASAMAHGPHIVARLESTTRAALAANGGAGIVADFRTPQGWLTRHPELSGGEALPATTRARVAAAVAALPGMGGVHWRLGSGKAASDAAEADAMPLHCQQDVEAILRTRTPRFGEGSAVIDPASADLLDEVAAALRPCVGSIIAVTGHTDAQGNEGANLTLSRARAEAVRAALARRGIPSDGLRATGVGSKKPVPGLEPSDPANRRIEFSVIATVPLKPTPVDTPGAGPGIGPGPLGN